MHPHGAGGGGGAPAAARGARATVHSSHNTQGADEDRESAVYHLNSLIDSKTTPLNYDLYGRVCV